MASAISFLTSEQVAAPIKLKAYAVFTLAALFYLYEYALQVSPSIMANSIMQSFQVGALGFGTISAFYFYSYAPLQIPAGLLYDKYGPRLLITLAILICVIGTVIYATTSHMAIAALGRFLIGTGSAFSFVGILVLLTKWFPFQRFALMTGIAQFLSSVGGICGQYPLAHLANHVGWRAAMLALAIIGLVLSLFVWITVRDNPENIPSPREKLHLREEWHKLAAVLKNAQTWWLATYTFAIWTPISVFAALWGVPFLCRLYHINAVMAASATVIIWVGIAIGSPFLGWLSSRINNYSLPQTLAALVGLIATVVIVYVPVNFNLIYLFLFALGFAAGGQTVTFTLVRRNNKLENVGAAAGFNNMACLLGGALFQPLVGHILKLNWQHVIVNNVPVYSIGAYQKALYILPLCYLLALLVNLFCIKHHR